VYDQANLMAAERETRTETASPAVAVRLDRVRKEFGGVTAVDGIDFEVFEGEFCSLLGPSGSGKTTCLRMITGFERPTSGLVILHGRDVTDVPPYGRDVNTVFQDYALFPHMSVRENVEYGLRVRRVPAAERSRRVAEALEMTRLPNLGARRPAELSGGQRQRVALARAIVNQPRVLLLDEPLGALDLKLRQQMQVELQSIHRRLGMTFLYVTHDQEEALTMSDRIAVMDGGRIEQVGTPSDVYDRPSTSFVAGFVGVSNVLSGEAARGVTGTEAPITVRPEKIGMVDPADTVASDDSSLQGTIRAVVYIGAFTRYVVELDAGGELVVLQQNSSQAALSGAREVDSRVKLVWARRYSRPLAGNDSNDGEEETT
jgi:putative spermidine/putrescine transport system ATP-binding protein